MASHQYYSEMMVKEAMLFKALLYSEVELLDHMVILFLIF